MFSFIFSAYKEEVYKKTGFRKDIRWYEWFWYGVGLASLIGSLVCWLFDPNSNFTKGVLVFGLLCMLGLCFFEDRKQKKNAVQYIQNYKNDRIKSLIKMLKGKPYHLYTPKGIDWLISCCDVFINQKTKSLLSNDGIAWAIGIPTYIFLITHGFSAIADCFDLHEQATLYFTILVVVIIIHGGTAFLKMVLTDLLFRDKSIASSLKQDLLYIKIFITGENK